MTGLEERATIVHGHRGVAADGTNRTSPSPPMQILAMRRPAAMLPRHLLPASMSASPSSPRLTTILSSDASATSRATSFAARSFTPIAGRRVHDFLVRVQARTISRRSSASALAPAAVEPQA